MRSFVTSTKRPRFIDSESDFFADYPKNRSIYYSADNTKELDTYTIPAYVMLDVTNISCVYALYPKVQAYTGPIIKIRRASDNVELDCYSHEEVVAHIGGSTGYVSVWYDQSGQVKHLTESSTSVQPTYIVSNASVGGRPVLDLSNNRGMSGTASITGGNWVTTVGYTAYMSGNRVLAGSNNWLIGPYSGTHQMHCSGFTGGVAVVLDAAKIASGYRAASAGGRFRLNGTLVGGAAGSDAPGNLNLATRGAFGEPAGSYIFEVIAKVTASTLTVTEIEELEESMNSYYGIY